MKRNPSRHDIGAYERRAGESRAVLGQLNSFGSEKPPRRNLSSNTGMAVRGVALLAVVDRRQRLDVDASARVLDILAIGSGELSAIGLVVGLCIGRDRRREERRHEDRRHKEQENAFHEMPDEKGRRPTPGVRL